MSVLFGLPHEAPRDGTTSVYLQPGQLGAFAERALITTVVGSCVAVCLWDNLKGIGGMNHFVLPEGIPGLAPAKTAESACRALLERILVLGAARKRLCAKVFGGASLLPPSGNEASIGQRNVDAARGFLSANGVPVLAEDILGPYGRRIVFSTSDGTAWVRLLGGPPR